ncbi:hypothetical protein [Brackiella oedipodis]|uniref:hypothetical protein n=1 Tax=Brackiella oedipodis TaxID=124225 RepID=UPI0012EBE248|nr:hypothetical protein [Brackiella oedipodis]
MDYDLRRVFSVNVYQSLMGSIIDYGGITINSQVSIYGLEKPHEFRKALNDYLYERGF